MEKKEELVDIFYLVYVYNSKVVEFDIHLQKDTIESLCEEFKQNFRMIFDRSITMDDYTNFKVSLEEYFPRRVGRFLAWRRRKNK